MSRLPPSALCCHLHRPFDSTPQLLRLQGARAHFPPCGAGCKTARAGCYCLIRRIKELKQRQQAHRLAGRSTSFAVASCGSPRGCCPRSRVRMAVSMCSSRVGGCRSDYQLAAAPPLAAAGRLQPAPSPHRHMLRQPCLVCGWSAICALMAVAIYLLSALSRQASLPCCVLGRWLP